MIQAFFNGLGGLLSFSKGLRNVSANVANMNTPGYRGSDTFFRNVGGDDGGLGVTVAGTALRTSSGELRQSGEATDIAIDGRGFFVLADDAGNLRYTRAGQFRLDGQQRLADRVSGMTLQAIDGNGSLAPVDLSAERLLPPQATTTVTFRDNLVANNPLGGTNTHRIDDVAVIDTTGATQSVSFTFTQDSTDTSRWHVEASSASSGSLGTGTLQFAADGTPAASANGMEITLGSGTLAHAVVLDFGTPGSINGLTMFSGTASTATARSADGRAASALSTLAVEADGTIRLSYADGTTKPGPRIALALFADETVLVQDDKALVESGSQTPGFGPPGSGALGRLRGGFLELSNVDLAQEFGDLIIIQRGYQASSRVMTVAGEMIEQLYGQGRGN